jgi:PPM family protein phosphatase
MEPREMSLARSSVQVKAWSTASRGGWVVQYVAVSALSHDGLMRDHNEDSLVVGPWTLCAATTPTSQTFYLPITAPVVVAVADGLGGHPAGEVASSLAVWWLARAAPTLTDDALVRSTLDACNELVSAEGARHPKRTAMGTTIAGLVVTEQGVIVFNIGDSRVYALDDGGLVQLSVDDNEPPAPGQQRSSVVTQTLGGSVDLEPVDPHISTQPLGDAADYLICSDGLTDALSDTEIAAIVASHRGVEAAFELLKATIEAGAPDNITVALVEIGTT